MLALWMSTMQAQNSTIQTTYLQDNLKLGTFFHFTPLYCQSGFFCINFSILVQNSWKTDWQRERAPFFSPVHLRCTFIVHGVELLSKHLLHTQNTFGKVLSYLHFSINSILFFHFTILEIRSSLITVVNKKRIFNTKGKFSKFWIRQSDKNFPNSSHHTHKHTHTPTNTHPHTNT